MNIYIKHMSKPNIGNWTIKLFDALICGLTIKCTTKFLIKLILWWCFSKLITIIMNKLFWHVYHSKVKFNIWYQTVLYIMWIEISVLLDNVYFAIRLLLLHSMKYIINNIL